MIKSIISLSYELNKVDEAGFTDEIKKYKDKVYSHEIKNLAAKMIEYQQYLNKYYRLHEEVKFLSKMLQLIFLKNDKQINLIVNYDV